MSDSRVCRICIRTDGKMYRYDRFELKLYYQEIMGENVTSPDYLPHYFCYECAALLHKFHKFKEKCYTAHTTLKGLLCDNIIPLKSIEKIDRKAKNLQSSINISYTTDRVKTCIVKRHRTKRKAKSKQDNEIIIKTEELNTDSSDSRNDYNMNTENKLDVKLNYNNYTEPVIFVDDKQMVKVNEYVYIDNAIKYDNILTNGTEIPEQYSNDNDINMDSISDYEDEIKLSEILHTIKKSIKTKPHRVKNAKRQMKKREKVSKQSKYKLQGTKKFEKRKRELDPCKWLTINLSEEQAVNEFKARAESSRYFAAEHKCVKCLKGFSTDDMLQRHVKLRHNDINPIECRHCQMRFKWKCKLTGHMSEHYTKYKCLRCDQTCLTIYGAIQHEDIHNGVTWNCQHCGEQFNHQNSYYTHLRTHKSEFVCTLCGASFVNDRGLYLHKRNKHRDVEAMAGDGEYCSRCDIRFETRAAYDEHFAHSAKHDDNKNMVGNGAKPLKQRVRRLKNKKRPANCHVCGKQFESQRAHRKHHLAEHRGAPLYALADQRVCEICGLSVAPNKMFVHRASHGGEAKPISCPVCGKRFKQEAGMKYHYGVFHETDPAKKKIPRKFNYRNSIVTCDICGANASSKANLQRHMLVHTGEKPFKCTLCEKRFTQKNSMQLHYRTFHLKEPYPKRNRGKRSGVFFMEDTLTLKTG